VLSGVAAAAAFPPIDWGPLAFVALVPLALVSRRAGPADVAVAAAAFGLTFFGLLFPWIHLFGMAAYLLLVGLEAAFVAAALAGGAAVRRRLGAGIGFVVFPLAFLTAEYLRSHLPLGGFPWGGLGYSQHGYPTVLRLASYTGVWGVSLLIALVNALVAEAVLLLKSAPVAGVAALVAAVLGVIAPALLPVRDSQGATAKLGIVQGSPRLGASSQEIARTQAALTATLAGSGADLIVWPESSMEGDPASDPGLLEPLLASIRRTRAYFVVGTTLDATGRRFRNVSLFYRPDGTLADTYVKIHLVPFGEYVPGRALLAGWIHELGRVPLDGIAGKVPEVFSLPQGKVGTVICYETAYPGLVRSFVRRGARLIIVSTNNSSYLRTAASAQMVAISQLRAAEQRMWVVQAALTGISAVIGPNGHLVDRTALFRPTALTPTVRFATGTTPYARFGDWLPIAAMLAGVGLAASAGARGTRREVA
jgi:apolipoprotein N-acyltransferase